jgi:hypothetical protein
MAPLAFGRARVGAEGSVRGWDRLAVVARAHGRSRTRVLARARRVWRVLARRGKLPGAGIREIVELCVAESTQP